MEDGGSILGLKIGDMVLLPCGTPGVIKDLDILHGGHVARVKVNPITKWWHHFYLAITNKLYFYDAQIYNLENLEPQLLAPRSE